MNQRTHTNTLPQSTISPVAVNPVVNPALLHRTMLKISQAAKDFGISQKEYRELLEKSNSKSFFLDGNKKGEFITPDMHLNLLSHFKEKFIQYSGIAIDDKDFQKAILKFRKLANKSKRPTRNYYTQEKIAELKKFCSNMNRRMERCKHIQEDGQEYLCIIGKMGYSFPYDKNHKLPKLRIKAREGYGQEIYLEYWAPEEILIKGKVVLEMKRKRLTGIINNLNPKEDFFSVINLIVFLYSKLKAGYVFRLKAMANNPSYETLMRMPFEEILMLPALYTLIENHHSSGLMKLEQYNNMKAHINVLTRYVCNIESNKRVIPEEINFRHKFIDFDHSDAVRFKDHMKSNINPRSGKPKCDTTVQNTFSDLRNLVNKIMARKKDIPPAYKNPFQGHKIKRSAPQVHVFYEPEELRELKDAILDTGNEQLLLLIMLMYYSGCRVVEAKRMQLANINFQRKEIFLNANQTKNKQPRTIPINAELRDILQKLNLENYPRHYYLLTKNRTPGEQMVSRNYFQKQFKKAREKAGLTKNHTMYSMRHTFAMNYMLGVRDGKDETNKMYRLMEYLGHEDFEVTKLYLKDLGYKLTEAETYEGFAKFGESPILK